VLRAGPGGPGSWMRRWWTCGPRGRGRRGSLGQDLASRHAIGIPIGIADDPISLDDRRRREARIALGRRGRGHGRGHHRGAHPQRSTRLVARRGRRGRLGLLQLGPQLGHDGLRLGRGRRSRLATQSRRGGPDQGEQDQACDVAEDQPTLTRWVLVLGTPALEIHGGRKVSPLRDIRVSGGGALRGQSMLRWWRSRYGSTDLRCRIGDTP
jgi:hypothetical protein